MALQTTPDQDDVLDQNPTGAAYDGTGSGATSGYGAASPDEDDDVDNLDDEDLDDDDLEDDIDDEDDDVA